MRATSFCKGRVYASLSRKNVRFHRTFFYKLKWTASTQTVREDQGSVEVRDRRIAERWEVEGPVPIMSDQFDTIGKGIGQ